MASRASDKKLAVLLPKLKKTHLTSNLELSGRQDKILALFKQDQISPEINNSRKFFSPKASHASKLDLHGINSHSFLPGTGNPGTFLTVGTPASPGTHRKNNSTLDGPSGTFS